jgi:hypothetical protein
VEKKIVYWYSTSAVIDFKKGYDSVRWEVFSSCGIPRKLGGLIQMCV